MTMPRVKIKSQSIAAIEGELLKRVRSHGQISRVALSRELQIVPSTAGIYVNRLITEDFLMESRKAEPGLGRPATLLALNPAGGRFVGVDFEARNLMATAVDFSQQPLRRVHKTIQATDSVAEILEKMERAIREVMAGDPRQVLGIGVGVPGVIDPAHGVAVRYDLIKGWQDIPLGERLRKKFGAPVFLENNIRCMALAELWFGGGRRLKDFICLGVRSGVAAGVVVNGHLLRGAGNQAGEIGHWSTPVPLELSRAAIPAGNSTVATKVARRSADFQSAVSPTSSRPRAGTAPAPSGLETRDTAGWKPALQDTVVPCMWQPGVRLEQVASLAAILSLAQQAKHARQKTALSAVKGELSASDLFQAVRTGDAYACSLIESVAWVHGWVVHQLCALFDTRKIIFTGPLVELGDFFFSRVRAAANQWGGANTAVEITGSALGTYNGALGAAALALHQWKPKR